MRSKKQIDVNCGLKREDGVLRRDFRWFGCETKEGRNAASCPDLLAASNGEVSMASGVQVLSEFTYQPSEESA